MACCEAPEPRILEKNGRLFCMNCKRYLSRESQQSEPDDGPPETPLVVEEKETAYDRRQ